MSFLEQLFGRGYVRGTAEPRRPLPAFPPSSEQPAKPYTMAMVDGENAEITMYGEIVEARPVDFWTGEYVEGAFIIQSEFLDDLEAVAGAKTLTIRMDSIGGDAGVSILIHNRLRDLAAKGTSLKCTVDGVAMSGGSLIMCACDEVAVNPSSLIMIHNAACTLWGGYNANELRQRSSALDAWDRAQVSIYKRKCCLTDQVISNLMAKTTYMTGAEAVEKGFADTLIEDAAPLDIAASADGRSLFVRGKQFHLTPGMFAPDSIPTVTSEGSKPPVEANKTQPAQTGGQNGGNTMAKTLEELRAENPALADALMAEALIACQSKAAVSASGAAVVPAASTASVASTATPTPQASGNIDPAEAERQRLQDIDALAGVFDAETIQAAKYGEHRSTAQEMVYRAAQKASQQSKAFLAAMAADTAASGAQNVGAANGGDGDGAGGPDTPQAVVAQARADAKAFNERKKEVR